LPFVGFLLAGNANAFRLMALPGGLAFFVIPPLIYFLIPESPRWYLRRGHAEAAVDTVNQMIRRAGRSRAAADGCCTWQQAADGARRAAALSGVVPSRSAALDGNRDLQLCLRRHRIFSDFGPIAKGAGRSGCRGHLEFWRKFAGVHREYTGKGLHRLPDGDYRKTLDNLLRPRRLIARPFPDDVRPSGRTLRDGDDGHGCGADRLY